MSAALRRGPRRPRFLPCRQRRPPWRNAGCGRTPSGRSEGAEAGVQARAGRGRSPCGSASSPSIASLVRSLWTASAAVPLTRSRPARSASRPGPPQSHPCPAAVLGDELDTGARRRRPSGPGTRAGQAAQAGGRTAAGCARPSTVIANGRPSVGEVLAEIGRTEPARGSPRHRRTAVRTLRRAGPMSALQETVPAASRFRSAQVVLGPVSP